MKVYVVSTWEDYVGELMVAVHSDLDGAMGAHEWVGPSTQLERDDPKGTIRKWSRKVDDTVQHIIREVTVDAEDVA